MENLNVKIDGEQKELVIREGEAAPIREEKIIDIKGTIGAPAEWYARRKEQLKPYRCHVLFSFEGMYIKLAIEDKSYFGTTITGTTRINPELEAFGINKTKTYTIKELKQFLKMNRFFFADQDENMKIVANLEKFRASVQTQIEQHGSNRGDKKNLLEVNVDTNLDMKFDLNLPIFLGEPKMKFQVEICFDIKDSSVVVWLESAELKHLILSNRDALINKNLQTFRDGGFVVIEQ